MVDTRTTLSLYLLKMFASGKREIEIMSKKKTTEEYKKQMFNIWKDEYKLLSEYNGNTNKVHVQHINCKNDYWVLPSKLVANSPENRRKCPFCYGGVKHTNEYVNKRLFELYHGEYVFLEEYVNSSIPIKCLHTKCNNTYMVTSNDILNGHRGCPFCAGNQKKTTDIFKNEVYDLVKDEYTILGEYITARDKISVKHNKCNTVYDVTPDNFLRGCRCPKCSKSKLENKTEEFLKNNNINYNTWKTYQDLVGVNNNLLSYDFYLPDYNMLVECQGIQHEQPVNFFGGEEQFKIQKEHDKRKKEYSKSHNIELLEIWYYEYNNVEEILTSRLALKQSA